MAEALGERRDPLVADVAKASIGVAGLALCLTIVFLGMRSVMDVGGACADGGPYVSAQPCPDGAALALTGGVLGLFVFGGIGAWFGSRVSGFWAATPLLAWSALFCSLGWNFLEYGLIDPPEGEGVIWGWLIPGILFELMGLAPLVGGLAVFGDPPARRPGRGRASDARSGGGGPRGSEPVVRTFPLRPVPGAGGTAAVGGPGGQRVEVTSMTLDGPRSTELAAIASGLQEAIEDALAETPADPLARAAAAPGADRAEAAAPDFGEGTQALLDRLERLADLRDRGLLAPDEYETAKEAVVRELEARGEAGGAA